MSHDIGETARLRNYQAWIPDLPHLRENERAIFSARFSHVTMDEGRSLAVALNAARAEAAALQECNDALTETIAEAVAAERKAYEQRATIRDAWESARVDVARLEAEVDALNARVGGLT